MDFWGVNCPTRKDRDLRVSSGFSAAPRDPHRVRISSFRVIPVTHLGGWFPTVGDVLPTP